MNTIRQAALDLYKPPFKYIGGYIFDQGHKMVADNGEIDEMRELFAARIRGWGRIQYLDNPKGRAEALQDEVGKIVAEALTAFWAAQTGNAQ